MTIWDKLTDQAHALLTTTRRANITPAVALVRTLHPTPPSTPDAICSHLGTATTVLPTLARYANQGDRHALLMAAVLMRHPLRKIAGYADPDGYHSSDYDARDNYTLAVFFNLIRTASEPQVLTSKYLYNFTLKGVLKTHLETGSPAAAVRLSPEHPALDRADHGTDHHAGDLLDKAYARGVITPLEYRSLQARYLHSGVFNLQAAANTLGANAGAVERRCQRAIKKLAQHHSAVAA